MVVQILENPVTGKIVEVSTEDILVKYHLVRQTLKALSLLEVGLHWIALASILERKEEGKGNSPGMTSAWLQSVLFSHEHHIHPKFKNYS